MNSADIIAKLKSITENTSNLDFIKIFSKAFSIPDSTLVRSGINEIKTTEFDIVVGKGQKSTFFISTKNPNLYNVLEDVQPDHKGSRYIIVIGENDIVCSDRFDNIVLHCSKVQIKDHISYFYPLLGISKTIESDEYSKKTIASISTTIHNQLLSLNEKPDHRDYIRFIVRLQFVLHCDSHSLNKISKLLCDQLSSDEEKGRIINAIVTGDVIGNTEIDTTIATIHNINPVIFEHKINGFVLNKKVIECVMDLCNVDWNTMSPDVVGSTLQSIATEDERASYSYSSVMDVYRVIGPLFLDELYDKLSHCKMDDDYLNLLGELRKITLFDPSCGTGLILINAFLSLKTIEEKIYNSVIDKSTIRDKISLSQLYGICADDLLIEIAYACFQMICADSITSKPMILHKNPLYVEWSNFCKSDCTYIICNPPYKGAHQRSDCQKEEVKLIFGGISEVDYSACWVLLASKYIHDVKGAKAAFITTNSLIQGQNVHFLWPRIFENDVEITFAYPPFKWKNNMKNNTGVTVAIFGLASIGIAKTKMIIKDGKKRIVDNIGPYFNTTSVVVCKHTRPISCLPIMRKGNMPYDGKNLILSTEEKNRILSEYPQAACFIKRLVGAEEIVNGVMRWCLWIHDEELDEAQKIPVIRDRIKATKDYRESNKYPSVQKMAIRSHQFRDLKETKRSSLVVPSVSSENRAYILSDFVDSSTIVTNLACVVYDCQAWVFGIVSSKMHYVWIKMGACGGLETRIRYSPELGYNTFPFPDISEEQKSRITQATFNIIAVRGSHPDMNLATLYNNKTIPPDLLEAHLMLDEIIDKCYREEPFFSDSERVEYLFKLYEQYTK